MTIHQSDTKNDKQTFTVFDGCRTVPLGDDFTNDTVIVSVSGMLIIEFHSGGITFATRERRFPLQKTGFEASFMGIPCQDEEIPESDFCDKTVKCEPQSDTNAVTGSSVCRIQNETELRQTVFGTYSVVTCTASPTLLCSNPISYLNTSYCDLDCPEYFRCQNNACVKRSSVCDGDPCNGCQEDDGWQDGVGFRCLRNGQFCRMPQSMLWDRIQDCDQGDDLCFSSDLEYSKVRDLRFLPSTTFKDSLCFYCLDRSMIIPHRKVCDGVIDCADLTDECLCERELPKICDDVVSKSIATIKTDTNSCSIGQVSCGDGSCINRTSVCDSVADCPDNRDERSEYCGVTLKCMDTKAVNCGQECRCQTSCSNNIDVLCGVKEECASLFNGASLSEGCGCHEEECFAKCMNDLRHRCALTKQTKPYPSYPECFVEARSTSFWTFTLPDKIELTAKQICDGVIDCTVNKVDEETCDDRFRCLARGLISIPTNKVCDGVYDCDDKSDEDRNICTHRFYCPALQKTKISIENKFVCDLHINCDDNSDEMGCPSDGRFYCESKSPLFVSKDKKFDGHQDCSDASDECPTTVEARNEDFFSSRYQLIANPILRGLVWVMGLTAFSGNMVVVCTKIKTMSKTFERSSSTSLRTNHMLLLNLAIADLLMGIYLIMLGIAGVLYDGAFCLHQLEWLSSSVCTAMGVLVVLSSEASVITMILLTSCRMYVVLKPFKASIKPKASTMYLLIGTGWLLSFVLAFVPLAESLQYIFANKALISQKSFFSNSVVSFDTAKSWAMRSVTYVPSQQVTNPDDILTQIQAAVSWKEFQSVVHNLNLSSSFKFTTNLGYYSANSVCIPRLFQTPEDDAFAFSFATATFNFLAFVYIAAAYTFIVIHTRRTSMNAAGMASDSRMKIDSRNAALQKKIFRLLTTDFCCWVPLTVMTFLYAGGVPLPGMAYVVSAIVLLPINSALNPILYSDVFDKIISKLMKFLQQNRASASSRGTTEQMTTSRGGTRVQEHTKMETLPGSSSL